MPWTVRYHNGAEASGGPSNRSVINQVINGIRKLLQGASLKAPMVGVAIAGMALVMLAMSLNLVCGSPMGARLVVTNATACLPTQIPSVVATVA